MTAYADEKSRRIKQFAQYVRLMGLRRHKFAKGDCFIIFDESAPEGADAPQIRKSAAIRMDCRANGSLASDGDASADLPRADWQPAECFRYIQFAFRRDCFYLELPKNTIFRNEAELILQQRLGFYWAKNRSDLRWVRASWKDIIKWDPSSASVGRFLPRQDLRDLRCATGHRSLPDAGADRRRPAVGGNCGRPGYRPNTRFLAESRGKRCWHTSCFCPAEQARGSPSSPPRNFRGGRSCPAFHGIMTPFERGSTVLLWTENPNSAPSSRASNPFVAGWSESPYWSLICRAITPHPTCLST